jgi:hypothetical protein
VTEYSACNRSPGNRWVAVPEMTASGSVRSDRAYGVARMTVRRAVAQLRDTGLVVTVHGRGSFVAPGDDMAQR